MGLINWIFDIYQHDQISRARTDAAEARAEIARVRGSSGVDEERLVRAIEELALATKTVQRVLVDKGIVSQSELEDTIRRIDREDGREDGRTPLL